MRVISGKFKGRKLFAPEGNSVRPTTDRIKETLFNILSSKMDFNDIVVLDLFCGSGALGVEAISRGAEKTIFVDASSKSCKLTKDNLLHICATDDEYELYCVDYKFAIKKLIGKKFNLILADPPYDLCIEDDIVRLIETNNILSDDGILVVEHSSSNSIISNEFLQETRYCGNTALTFLSYNRRVTHNE